MASPAKRRVGALEIKLGIVTKAVLWPMPGCEPMTGEQIRELLRLVDGKTRGIPSTKGSPD